MDATAMTTFFGDNAALFMALESVQLKAQNHVTRFNEQMAAVAQKAGQVNDAAQTQELGEISLILYQVHALLFGSQVFNPAPSGDSPDTPQSLEQVTAEMSSLLDQSLNASARIETLLVQSAQRLSELEAAQV